MENVVKVQHFIGGEWTDSEKGEIWRVTSPSTGESIAELRFASEGEVDLAVQSAQKARQDISGMSRHKRADLLERIARCIEQDKEAIAQDLSKEQGKPYLREAIGEVEETVRMWRHSAEVIRTLESEVLPSWDPAKRIFTVRQPRGVYAIFTPWNFPSAIPTEYLCAGLAAGNTIVWKPSEYTPMTAVNLVRCCTRAGVPAGVLNLVLGDGAIVGAALARHPGVAAVCLTGSPATGDKVARAAGAKPMLLELGGSCPVIIFEDADLKRAIRRTAIGGFRNAGQTCNSVDRVLVHESISDQIVDGLTDASQSIVLGPSLDPKTTMGPLNNAATVAKVDLHLRDAVDHGAEIRAGGGRADGFQTDLYYQPTVVDRVKPDMLLNREETFGPVLPVLTFSQIEEAIDLANGNDLGLVAGVFTQDLRRASYMAERLHVGIVNINEVPTYWQSHTPFGGYSGKRSGVGRLGGKYTVLEMSQLKTIVIDTGRS